MQMSKKVNNDVSMNPPIDNASSLLLIRLLPRRKNVRFYIFLTLLATTFFCTIVFFTGLARCDKLDEILEDNELRKLHHYWINLNWQWWPVRSRQGLGNYKQVPFSYLQTMNSSIRSLFVLVCPERSLGFITSRCSGKEPALFPRRHSLLGEKL